MTKAPRIQEIGDYMKAINVQAPTRFSDLLVVNYGTLNLEAAAWLPAFKANYFEIMLDLTPGCPIRVDEFELLSVANRLTLVSPYRLQSALPATKVAEQPYKGYGIFFTPEFMYGQLLKDFPFFNPFNTPTVYLDTTTAQQVTDLFNKIQYEHDQYGAFSKEIIKSYLQVVFLKAKQHYHHRHTIQLTRDAEIFHSFEALVQKHFTEWHTVKAYADRLHISSKHLSETVKKVSGQSALQFIHKTQLSYASAQLLQTAKPVSEIAWELNFENPDYFSVFFKRMTGKSPVQFRSL